MTELRVSVVYAPAPRVVHEWQGVLPAGATVQDALHASGMGGEIPDDGKRDIGIWGRKVRLLDRLVDGDRVEIYRGLTVDPKVARRERFQKQGARSSGLFAKKRPGAKAGY
jgi:putative ubiquitin-RnfH superfamily antitoxin RatB of RatAB toxin-antitoxin module